MAERMPLALVQAGFAAHLRDPQNVAAPGGIEERRLAIYRELVYNNLADLLGGNFPVIRSLFEPPDWETLIRSFLRDHRARTPLFTEIAREFIGFLQERADAGMADPAFLVELAHYEWSELALSLDEASIDAVACDEGGDVVHGVPVTSPLARLLAYRFPVHEIGPAFRPDAVPAQPTLILLVRDRTDEVRFLAVEPLTAMLFERLAVNTTASGLSCLHDLLDELGRNDHAMRESGLAMLHDLRRREILLGCVPSGA